MRHLNQNRQIGSAHHQIAIKAVTDDILLLPGHRYRYVLEASALNFELKSEAERDSIIDAYQNFINGLGFPLQLLVQIREIDVDSMLEELNAKADAESSPVYRKQLQSYARYLSGIIQSNKILSRSFYAVVPFDDKDDLDFMTAKERLRARSELVAKGLQRLGTYVRPLSGLEVLNLFYGFYNPLQAKQQPLGDTALKLMHFAIKAEVK